jgi:hypothetical protein
MIDDNFPYKDIGTVYFKDGTREAILLVDAYSDTYIKFVSESGTYVYRPYGVEPEEVKSVIHRVARK